MSRGGERIREIREQLELSQARLGELLGVDEKTIRRWEKGETSPIYDHVKAAEDLLAKQSARGARVAEGTARYDAKSKARRSTPRPRQKRRT